MKDARLSAFIISELVTENQQGVKLPPPNQTRVNDVYDNSDIAILHIKRAGCGCIIRGANNSEAINVVQNIDLIQKSRTLKKHSFCYHI